MSSPELNEPPKYLFDVRMFPMETTAPYVHTTIVEPGPATLWETVLGILALLAYGIVQSVLLAASIICFAYGLRGILR